MHIHSTGNISILLFLRTETFFKCFKLFKKLSSVKCKQVYASFWERTLHWSLLLDIAVLTTELLTIHACLVWVISWPSLFKGISLSYINLPQTKVKANKVSEWCKDFTQVACIEITTWKMNSENSLNSQGVMLWEFISLYK